jgi:hypothetical protein
MTITDICNAAISHCGTRSKISAIDEGSPEANACLTHFAMVRDATLRAYDWNFARMTVSLAQLSNPPQRWLYEYAVPVDCLRIRRLNDTPEPWPETLYERAADKDSTGATIGVILSNLSPLSAIYTAQVTDVNQWDAGFLDAVVYGLATRACFELTGKEERAPDADVAGRAAKGRRRHGERGLWLEPVRAARCAAGARLQRWRGRLRHAVAVGWLAVGAAAPLTWPR